jgi:hypothetical protein
VITPELLAYFAIPQAKAKAVVLPADITVEKYGAERNGMIMKALGQRVKKGSFVMAQPYVEDTMASLYQLSPAVTAYFNDKHHMPEYIGAQWLPKRFKAFENGKEFAENVGEVALPAVIKVSSSSSGDGVCICTKAADVQNAVDRFSSVTGRVFIEEHIDFQKSYGVHFGIPHDPKKPADIIGINEQITTMNGAFLGGIIEHFSVPPALDGAVQHLIDYIIPKVRAKGWYGIGGFDVLVDGHGKAYFIDANFRMTGMSAYHFLIDRGLIQRPMMSIMGTFVGDEQSLRDALSSFAAVDAPNRFLKIICMSRNNDVWRFNAALEYADEQQLARRIEQVLAARIESEALESVRLAFQTS